MEKQKLQKPYSYTQSCIIMYTPYLLSLVATIILFPILEKIILNNLVRIAIVDLICTVIVFVFSYIFKNSSIYDPYWQIPTAFFVVYMNQISPSPYSIRNILLITPVLLYCLKHNYFYMKFWPGLGYEDFRYKNFCEKFKNYQSLYWPFSFLAFHLYPSCMVLTALLPIYYSLQNENQKNYDFITYFGIFWSLLGLAIQTVADQQLLPWRLKQKKGKYIDEGIWRYSRHPNYLGDIILWQGFYFSVLGVGQNFEFWWTIVGHLINFSTFNFFSVPAMEKHILQRTPEYKQYQKDVSRLFPWFRASNKDKSK